MKFVKLLFFLLFMISTSLATVKQDDWGFWCSLYKKDNLEEFVFNVDKAEYNFALAQAALMGAEKIVRYLIREGVDINHLSPSRRSNGEELSPLMAAAEAYRIGTVQILLAAGADVNKTSKRGTTALITGAPSPDITRILLDAGAGSMINTPSADGTTPLLNAIGCVFDPKGELSEEAVRTLIKAGADVTLVIEPDGDHALLYSVKNPKVTQILLDAGASKLINLPEKRTQLTALMIATGQNALEVVKVLLKNGADPNIKNFENNTALDIAIFKQFGEVAKILIEAGGKPASSVPQEKTK